jgi:23S rRNA pseudouridine1911/1915/1917 synthase
MLLEYAASVQNAGKKVYYILRRELMLSETMTRRLKKAGAILVDGAPARTDRRLAAGEMLTVDISAAEPSCSLIPEKGSLDILYEDAGLIAINKPPGIITHPSRARITGTLANLVAGYWEETSGDGC